MLTNRVRSQWTERPKVTLKCDPLLGVTQQHMREECDINRIVKHFTQTGQLDHVQTRPPQYGNASEMSFHEAMINSVQATQNFEQMDQKIQDHYKNDVSLYLDAISDPSHEDELRELGLIPPLPIKEETKEPEQAHTPPSVPAEQSEVEATKV